MAVVINGTTGISGVDGSAGTPALQGSDPDTGIFYGTNTVSISTNGSTAVTVDANGDTTIANDLIVNGTTTQTGSTTFTAQTLFPDGTVSAPSISNTGDVNTGVYFPAADNVAIATGGVAALTADSSQNVSVTNTLVMGSSFKRNRIINGDMRVDQRATAVTTDDAYSVDRWLFGKLNDATESVAQNTDAPTGFSYSLRNTISVADASIGAAQYSLFRQYIEGFNTADLLYGTNSAATVTVSFWVKATQTGTYSVSLSNTGFNRNCWKQFSVSVSNTWEYKTLTFVGPNASVGGTWNTTNGRGIAVSFNFALGSNFLGGSDGVWSTSGVILGPSGMTNGIGTNGNIYAITGVQLEVGSIATPYERQIYSDQLAQCQRYYQKFTGGGAGGNVWDQNTIGILNALSSTDARGFVPSPVVMRTNPTISSSNVSIYNGVTSTTSVLIDGGGGTGYGTIKVGTSSTTGMSVGTQYHITFTAASSGYVTFSSEL